MDNDKLVRELHCLYDSCGFILRYLYTDLMTDNDKLVRELMGTVFVIQAASSCDAFTPTRHQDCV